MTKKNILFASLLSLPLLIHTQNNRLAPIKKIYQEIEKDPFKRLQLSGYVKHESFWDSRQIVASGEGQLLLYPKAKLLDAFGNDINKHGEFNSVAIETRLHVDVYGPKIHNAYISGEVEADFFGKTPTTTDVMGNGEIPNIFRLRLAHIQLDWKNWTVALGQSWHPIFVANCFADTISFNNGEPIDPYVRTPMIKAIYYRNNTHITLAATSELDSPSDGPDGFNPKYMRNAIIPNLNMRVDQLVHDHVTIGAGIDYKRLVPRLVTKKNIKTSEALNSFSGIVYATYESPSFKFSTKFSYLENCPDYGCIGGYAVSSVNSQTDKRTYTNLRALSIWFDTALKKNIAPGLFVGYIKNIGSSSCVITSITENNITENTVYGLGTDINHVFRISPRLRWYIKKFLLGIELEHTRAGYGCINNRGRIDNVDTVSNTRLLIAAYYYF